MSSARGPAPALFMRLIDDAAVFPPGSSPLPQAVADHRHHTTQWYALLTGSLLVPATSWRELTEIVAGLEDAGDVLRVGLISRPGGDAAVLHEAIDGLAEHPTIEAVGAEFGWYDGWLGEWASDSDADAAGLRTLAIEIPRGADQARALDEVRDAYRSGGLDRDVVAKFRTGPTPTWEWPDEDELAGFLVAVAGDEAGRVPFKLTGGLHHAVRGQYVPAGGQLEDNHGLLNVLVATEAARCGAEQAEVAQVLADTVPARLASTVAGWDDETVEAVRESFVSYGCCTVTDPIGELSALGLLDH